MNAPLAVLALASLALLLIGGTALVRAVTTHWDERDGNADL